MARDRNRLRRRIDAAAQHQPTSPTPDFPRAVMVEVSNLCNHACSFCAYPKMTRPGRRLELDLGRRLLAEAYDLGAREVGLYSGAEPFTSPHFEDIIKVAKAIGYEYIFSSTNGSLASETRLKACFDNGLDSIKFSINAGDRETYTKIHGQDHFDRVLRNIRFAHDYRDEAGLDYYISVSFVLIDNEVASNAATRNNLHALVGELADELLFFDADSENGQMIGLGRMGVQAPCVLPFARAHFSAEGYLRACCNDYQNYLAVADLQGTTLVDAWQSPVFQDLRRRHLEGRLEGTLCHNCIHNVNAPMAPLVPSLAVKVAAEHFEFKRPPR